VPLARAPSHLSGPATDDRLHPADALES
jgi:hypothetical protein